MLKIDERRELISLCNKYNLPMNVKSTCIKIYNLINQKVSVDNLLYLILVVSSKCEEIHELKIPNLPLKQESLIHEALNFNYDFSSPYLKMCSILVKLQLDNLGNFTGNFEEGCRRMDLLLINDDDTFNDTEKSLVALQLPYSVVESICDINKIKKCADLLNA